MTKKTSKSWRKLSKLNWRRIFEPSTVWYWSLFHTPFVCCVETTKIIQWKFWEVHLSPLESPTKNNVPKNTDDGNPAPVGGWALIFQYLHGLIEDCSQQKMPQPTWRMGPHLVSTLQPPMYKPWKGHWEGEQPLLGDLLAMVADY